MKIESTLTAELRAHIDSLTLTEARTMLSNLTSEIKRLRSLNEDDSHYNDEYRYLYRTIDKLHGIEENAQCEELAKLVNEEYKKLFPHSHTYFRKECIGNGWFLMVFLGDKESFYNGIEHNDPLRHHYRFSLTEKGLCVNAKGVSLSSLKPKDHYHYCSHKKLTFRKKEGDLKKVVDAMAKHFKTLRDFVDTEKVNMLDSVKGTYEKF
jgi:hypothetical protein